MFVRRHYYLRRWPNLIRVTYQNHPISNKTSDNKCRRSQPMDSSEFGVPPRTHSPRIACFLRPAASDPPSDHSLLTLYRTTPSKVETSRTGEGRPVQRGGARSIPGLQRAPRSVGVWYLRFGRKVCRGKRLS